MDGPAAEAASFSKQAAEAASFSEQAAVEAAQLTKHYGNTVAVDGISFEVRDGECFGLLGPNGAGKTTTIRMITCSSPVTSGHLVVSGHDVSREPRQVKSRIGVVPQDENLDPDLPTRQNLEVYARYFGLPSDVIKQRVSEQLAFFELEGKAKDPQARHLVWQQLRRLSERGVTQLLTTHYMDEAAQLCDRIVVMHHGTILAEGTPRSLVRDHAGERVLELHIPSEQRDALLAEAHSDGIEMEAYGDVAYLFGDEAALTPIAHQIGDDFRALLRPANLEDVFLRLTGRELLE